MTDTIVTPSIEFDPTALVTRAALEGSIVKWREIVAGERENEAAGDCPLCQLFNPYQTSFPKLERVKDGCLGCPVMARTGQSFCRGSPYERYEDLESTIDSEDEDSDEDYDDNVDRLLEIAKEELAFLESLR